MFSPQHWKTRDSEEYEAEGKSKQQHLYLLILFLALKMNQSSPLRGCWAGWVHGAIPAQCGANSERCTQGKQTPRWEKKLKQGFLEGTFLCLTLSALFFSLLPGGKAVVWVLPVSQHPQNSSRGWSWSPVLPWGLLAVEEHSRY